MIVVNVWIIQNKSHLLQLEISHSTLETFSISDNYKNDKNNNLKLVKSDLIKVVYTTLPASKLELSAMN